MFDVSNSTPFHVVAHVAVSNRSNNLHYVRIKVACAQDTAQVPTIYTSGMALIPARSSTTIQVSFQTAGVAGAGFVAVAIETRYPAGDPDRPIIHAPDGDDWSKTDSTDWYCAYTTPAVPTTWGSIKLRYR